jgi:hypothetical protein
MQQVSQINPYRELHNGLSRAYNIGDLRQQAQCRQPQLAGTDLERPDSV